jgi:hypothetical protein
MQDNECSVCDCVTAVNLLLLLIIIFLMQPGYRTLSRINTHSFSPPFFFVSSIVAEKRLLGYEFPCRLPNLLCTTIIQTIPRVNRGMYDELCYSYVSFLQSAETWNLVMYVDSNTFFRVCHHCRCI